MYTVDYFINKFEAIPEREWIEGAPENQWGKCAGGHCGLTEEKQSQKLDEVVALANIFYDNGIFESFMYGSNKVYSTITLVNDGYHPNYQQPTPKQRILAALYDIKKAQSPTYPDLTKELAVLPVDRVETDIKVLTPTS